MIDRRQQIRYRMIAAAINQADYGPELHDDLKWLLSRLAIATNRSDRLYAALRDAADRLSNAPCHDTNRPIERAMREALANDRQRP